MMPQIQDTSTMPQCHSLLLLKYQLKVKLTQFNPMQLTRLITSVTNYDYDASDTRYYSIQFNSMQLMQL